MAENMLVSSRLVSSRLVGQSVVLFVYLCKKIEDVICLFEIVLYINVNGWYTQFDEFLFEGAGLFEQAPCLFNILCFHTDIVILKTQKALLFRLCS